MLPPWTPRLLATVTLLVLGLAMGPAEATPIAVATTMCPPTAEVDHEVPTPLGSVLVANGATDDACVSAALMTDPEDPGRSTSSAGATWLFTPCAKATAPDATGACLATTGGLGASADATGVHPDAPAWRVCAEATPVAPASCLP